MATHATVRQRVISENIANANTPGYRQRDVVAFDSLAHSQSNAVTLRATRPGHRNGDEGMGADLQPRVVRSATQGPNGNTVSLEGEIMKTAQVRQQHDTALAVYRSTMTILRSVITHR